MKRPIIISLLILIGIATFYLGYRAYELHLKYNWGDEMDSLDNVSVYFNGSISTTKDRNVIDGYNVGLKYQCVEFVKRYYLIHYNHKMPNTYGHAKDFFLLDIKDGGFNRPRDLQQFTNPSSMKPLKGDLIVMGAGKEKYGHVAIVAEVGNDYVEIIQQNPGIGGKTRVRFGLKKSDELYQIDNNRINGWLRK